jgi:hypothetical protein
MYFLIFIDNMLILWYKEYMGFVKMIKNNIEDMWYRILFIIYLKVRPNKKEALYIKNEEYYLVSRSLLLLLIFAIILLIWNQLLGIIALISIGYLMLNYLLEPINLNKIIGKGLIKYLNYYLKTNDFNNISHRSKYCLTYKDDIVILDQGFYGDDKTEYLVTFNESNRMIDPFLYVEIGSYRNVDFMSNDLYRMNKVNMMGLDNEDFKLMLLKLDEWLFKQNPARAILKKIQ